MMTLAGLSIDYSELSEKICIRNRNILYDMENHGYDFYLHSGLTFFGNAACNCFNKLVIEKVWFMKFYS